MPHVQGHGGDFGAQYSRQIADTASKIGGLENTKTFQDIVSERAENQLQSLIDQSKADSDFRNQPAELTSILQDMPADRADFVLRNTRPDGTLNSAAEAMLAPYKDGRSEFQRELSRGIDNDPAFAQAYAERFPITNLLMTLPSTILESTIPARVISGALNKGRDVADFAGGLFPGAGATFQGIGEDFATAPAGIQEDFTTMLGINKDDNPVKSVLREELDIKKNTSNDISPDTFMKAEDRNPGIANLNVSQGTPVSEAFFSEPTVDEFLRRNNQFTEKTPIKEIAMRSGNAFDPNNPGQMANFIRDNSGYFDRVIKQLGLMGR